MTEYVCMQGREVGENVNVRGWWSTIHREVKKKEQAGWSGFAVRPAVMLWKPLIFFTTKSWGFFLNRMKKKLGVKLRVRRQRVIWFKKNLLFQEGTLTCRCYQHTDVRKHL